MNEYIYFLYSNIPSPNPIRLHCLSQKGCGPHIKEGSLEPSIPAGESGKWPPIMRLTVEALPHDKGIKMK